MTLQFYKYKSYLHWDVKPWSACPSSGSAVASQSLLCSWQATWPLETVTVEEITALLRHHIDDGLALQPGAMIPVKIMDFIFVSPTTLNTIYIYTLHKRCIYSSLHTTLTNKFYEQIQIFEVLKIVIGGKEVTGPDSHMTRSIFVPRRNSILFDIIVNNVNEKIPEQVVLGSRALPRIRATRFMKRCYICIRYRFSSGF